MIILILIVGFGGYMVTKKLVEGVYDVVKIVDEAKEVKSFYLRIPEFEYEPGHFVMVAFPEESQDKKKRRAYSISSSPIETEKDGLISITIKHVENGFFTSRLFNDSFATGSKLFVAGPFGHSVFAKVKNPLSVVLFAAGSGIAPIRAVMKYIYDKEMDTKVTLFYSFRTPEDYIFKKDIEEMLKKDNFRGFITITRPTQNSNWHGIKGRIDKNLVLDNITGKEDIFYLCGNTSFVKEMEGILINDLGVQKASIISEAWG